MGFIFVGLLIFAVFTWICFVDCRDKAEDENFRKDLRAWNEAHPAGRGRWIGSVYHSDPSIPPPPVPPYRKSWFDRAVDWFIDCLEPPEPFTPQESDQRPSVISRGTYRSVRLQLKDQLKDWPEVAGDKVTR